MIDAFKQDNYTIDKTAHEANIRNIVVSAFSFLLLKFDGDATYWSLLDPLHQMCHKTLTTETKKWGEVKRENKMKAAAHYVEILAQAFIHYALIHGPKSFSPCYFIPELFAWDYCYFVTYPFVHVKVIS